jgi:hypothetical protein
MARARRQAPKAQPITFETVRQIAGALPGAEESTSYGTPAFKVCGKLFVRLHQTGESLVVRIDETERAMRMRADPETYFITDHYLGYPWILVRLSSVSQDDLAELLEQAWRLSAPARLAAPGPRAKGSGARPRRAKPDR